MQVTNLKVIAHVDYFYFLTKLDQMGELKFVENQGGHQKGLELSGLSPEMGLIPIDGDDSNSNCTFI